MSDGTDTYSNSDDYDVRIDVMELWFYCDCGHDTGVRLEQSEAMTMTGDHHLPRPGVNSGMHYECTACGAKYAICLKDVVVSRTNGCMFCKHSSASGVGVWSGGSGYTSCSLSGEPINIFHGRCDLYAWGDK